MDYTSVSQTINFSAQTTSQVVNVAILDDLVYEPHESFSVNLISTTDTRITLGDTTAEISIENDELIELALDSEMIIVQESSSAQLCVVRSDDGTVTMGSTISFDVHLGFTDSGSALESGQDNPTSVEINANGSEWCASFNTQDVDSTTDVQFELRRTPLHPRDARLSAKTRAIVRVIDPPDCAANGAVTDATNTGLEEDCNDLLTAKEYLRGTATLNWSDSLPIENWERVTRSETPLRVTELNLGNKGLNGTIPSELGQLDRLKKLRLGSNSLTGGIPTELNSLLRTDEFYLNSNRLSGEIPVLSDLGRELGSTAVIYFRLGNNELTGDIQNVQLPTERMKELDLSNNSLTGDPSVFLESIQGSIQYGPSGLTNIRLSQNSFDTCIPLSFVEELNERAKRASFSGFYDPSAGLQHDFGSITCDRVPFSHRPAQDFEDLPNWFQGTWSDGTTLWGSNGTKIYAYNVKTKSRDTDKELDVASECASTGIWSNGSTMWMASWSPPNICAYNLETKLRETSKEIPLDADNHNAEGIWSDGTTMWVSNWNFGGETKIFAYDFTTKERISGEDFDNLGTNSTPGGIWSDGTTMWVSGLYQGEIYAYNLSDKQRDSTKDFDALNSGNSPEGIWSDGKTMWVSNQSPAKIYAYYMPPNTVGGTFETDTSTRLVIDPTDPDPDPDPPDPDKIEVEMCVAEVKAANGAEEVSGGITLGDTITGKWEAGCPSITRGARLAKYYTLTVPIISGVKIALDSHLDTYLVLRSGGLSGSIIAEDDDDGEGNNSLIEQTLPAGEYTIEATTFYSDGVEAEFTLTVTSVPRVLYDGPVSAVAHSGYAPTGPTMTVRLLPTLPRGTLEITINDASGFGAGAGPLGGPWGTASSAGTVMIVLSRSVWLEYDDLKVEVEQAGTWSTHTLSGEESLLADEGAGGDFATTLDQLPALIENAEDASSLIESLNTLMSSASVPAAAPDYYALDSIFTDSHANCVSQVTVPWLVESPETTGVRVSVPVENLAGSYLSVAASFVANGDDQALAQLHDLLDTEQDTPACTKPDSEEE